MRSEDRQYKAEKKRNKKAVGKMCLNECIFSTHDDILLCIVYTCYTLCLRRITVCRLGLVQELGLRKIRLDILKKLAKCF